VLQSIDDSIRGTPLERFPHLYVDAGAKLGRDMLAPMKYKEWLTEAGFVDVVEEKLPVPGNPWPRVEENKRMGHLQMTNFLNRLDASVMTVFTRGLGWTPEDVYAFLGEMREAIKNPAIHFYFTA